MTVLITGGTGFVGAHVARLLIQQQEQDITIFDINPSTKFIDDIVEQVTVVRGDLGNFSHVLNVVSSCKPRTIFHLGGMLSVPSDADHAASFRANAMGTFHILEAARLFGVEQVIFSSTLATYGLDLEEGITVDDYSLQRPQLFYGTTKVFSELMGQFYRRKFGLDFRGVRYPSIVGPGVKTPGIVQYTSWMIEDCIKGKRFHRPCFSGYQNARDVFQGCRALRRRVGPRAAGIHQDGQLPGCRGKTGGDGRRTRRDHQVTHPGGHDRFRTRYGFAEHPEQAPSPY